MRGSHFPEPYSQSALLALRVGLFAATVAGLSVAIARAQTQDPTAGLTVFGAAIVLACGALFCAVAAAGVIWRKGRRGLGAMLGGGGLALALLAYPGYLAVLATRLPVLNDVSADIYDPPQFLTTPEALAARGGWTPPPASIVARQAQQAAYPDVQPILLEMDVDEAYQLVLKAVRARHWAIILRIAPAAGATFARIEALDRSLVMALPSYITIRLRQIGGQTKIDARAVSRYGRHDFGDNAARLESFAQAVQDQLDAK